MRTANQPNWQLWLRIRWMFDALFGEKSKTSPAPSEADNRRSLTTGQQIYALMRSEGAGLGYFYQQPRANPDPLDQLLLPAAKEGADERRED